MSTSATKEQTSALREAALDGLQRLGKSLTRKPESGKRQLYLLGDETVLLRTQVTHKAVFTTDRPLPDRAARLPHLQDVDWLLFATFDKERAAGKVRLYLMPAQLAAQLTLDEHHRWIEAGGNTKGANRTPTLDFDHDRLQQYRLNVDVNTNEQPGNALATAIASARQQIARAAGVAPEAVSISVAF